MWQINTIKKYKGNHSVFLETGTWMGDGIETALGLGFDLVMSCDIDKEKVVNAEKRFAGRNVKIFHESSQSFLKNHLSSIDQPCVIWLDAHIMPDSTGVQFSKEQLEMAKNLNVDVCPLVDELKIIFEQSKHRNIILIDDYHCFGSWEFKNLLPQTIIELILSKDSTYNFSVEENVLCCF